MNNSSPHTHVSEVGFVALRQNQPAPSGRPSKLIAPLCAALLVAARRVPPRCGLFALLLLLSAGPLAAQQMNYQGRLTDANGNAVADGQYTLRFDIFDAATAGTRLWGTQTNVADVVQGRFNVVLGPTTPTPVTGGPLGNAFNGGNRFLQITVGNNAPILPRQQMLAAPEALHTLRADSAINAGFATNAGTASVADRSGYATNAGTANFAAVAAAVGSGGSSVITISGNNVGIGTASPFTRLANTPNNISGTDGYGLSTSSLGWVSAGFGYAAGFYNPGIGNGAGGVTIGIAGNATANRILDLWSGSTANPVMVVYGNNRVGINKVNPQETLDVDGTVRGTGFRCRAGTGGAVGGNVFNFDWTGSSLNAFVDNSYVGSVFFGFSDRRLKEEIHPMENEALARVMSLRPVSFKYKNVPGTPFSGRPETQEGFIADEVQQVIPSGVNGKKDELTPDGKIKPQSLNPMPFISVLTKATQELTRKVEAQESELTGLRAELAQLRRERKSFAATVEDMQARFARLEQAMNKTTPTAAKDLRASADVK